MNRYLRAFKTIAAQAADAENFRMNVFMRDYGLHDFLLEIVEDNDTVQEIAAKALRHLCIDDSGQFNGFLVGVKTVITFLDEHCTPPPTSPGKKQCFQDLKGILDRGGKLDELLRWANGYYQ